MTENEFKTVTELSKNYYELTEFDLDLYDFLPKRVNIGNVIIFCSKSFVPDSCLILNSHGVVKDGFHVCGEYYFNGKLTSEIINTLSPQPE